MDSFEQFLASITFGDLTIILALALIGLIAYGVALRLIDTLLIPLVRRARPGLDTALRQQRFSRYAALLVPPVVIKLALVVVGAQLGSLATLISQALEFFVILDLALLLNALLRAIEHVVEPERKALGALPLRRLFQILRVTNIVLAAILALGVFYDIQLGWVLGSLGLLAAAASIVFGDLIYNVVARTILVSQNLVAVGNWISIPALSIDGQVRTVGSFLIEVENWDKSVATVPPRYLLTNSFRSWQQMTRSGSRRIMHTLYLDLASVRPADVPMLAEARTLPGVAAYLDGLASVSTVTNIALYRAAVRGYLETHPQVQTELPFHMFDLDATHLGLPVQILAFLRETAELPYRLIDAEIYEHALVLAGNFGLCVYQVPGDHELRDAVAPVERGPLDPDGTVPAPAHDTTR
ncbi:MAG: mechanosensitive ion channel [Chloroflexales bacterium]|nr:mechanosensitive ion channel [Chloroflexales bacterium]